MDEAEKALVAEGQAAGAPGQPPPGGEPEEAVPPLGDAVMEIEDDEEHEQMKIVRDYKRPEQRQDPLWSQKDLQRCHALQVGVLTTRPQDAQLGMVTSIVPEGTILSPAALGCLVDTPKLLLL